MSNSSARPLTIIGVPVFNSERSLRQALESAMWQDEPNLEIPDSDGAPLNAPARNHELKVPLN